jgi:hypothetical protein
MHGGTFMKMELFKIVRIIFLKPVKNAACSTKIDEPTKINQSEYQEFLVFRIRTPRNPGFVFM